MLLITAGAVGAAEPPKLDKARVEAYLRYAEGYTAGVKFEIDDPVKSAFPGLFRVIVHLTSGASKLDRAYYVTPDGQRLINGAIWDLKESPFQETLGQLPTDGYAYGPADAKVTIVVFSDFECPFCRTFAKTLRENLPKKYPDVRVIFKDFPLEAMHPWARAAAEASHCLGDQKLAAFWAFHDAIFDAQKDVNAANLREKTLAIVREQKLDEAKAASCLDTHATAGAVERSTKIAQLLQVQQTPTSFINGRMEAGALPWAGLDAIIQLELGRPKEVPGPAAEACCEVSIPKIPRRP